MTNNATSKIVKESVILLVAVIICMLFINILYYNIVIKSKQLYIEDKQFQELLTQNNKIDYVFTGASVTQLGINPQYIPGSFNLGYLSESYMENYYRLRAAVNDGAQIKYLVIEQDLSSFSEYMLGGKKDSQLLYDFWHYSKITTLEEQLQATHKYAIQLYLLKFFPVLGRGMDFSVLLSEKSSVYLGFAGTDTDYSKTEMDTYGYRRVQSEFYGWKRIAPELEKFYLKLINLAHDNNMTVVLIRMPMAASYEKHLATFNVTKDDYYSYLDNITQQNIGEFYVLDYYSLFFEHPEYFANADHLNIKGSEVLSRKLYEDLTELEKTRAK